MAGLHGVAAASCVLTLADQSITFPANFTGIPGGGSPQPSSATLDGVDTGQTSVGPLAAATIISGHGFTAADSDADVALVDSACATSNGLTVGSAITISQARFAVIGIVSQPQGTSPPDVYIPLARAQALGTVGKDGGGSLANEVSLIYVAAASAADIPAVQIEISRLLPGDTVTTAGCGCRAAAGPSEAVADIGTAHHNRVMPAHPGSPQIGFRQTCRTARSASCRRTTPARTRHLVMERGAAWQRHQ